MQDEAQGTEPGPVRVARMLDAPRRRRVPVTTLSLVAVNVMMAVVQVAAGGFGIGLDQLAGEPVDWALGAKVPSLIAHGEYWRLVTANFLHASFLHLILNMVALFLLGQLLEVFYGPARLLVLYSLACVAGSIASYQFTPNVSEGASTGILGLMGALIVHNVRYRGHLPPRVNRLLPVLLIFLLIQFQMDLMSPTTDLAGHLGGLLGGVIMAALLEGRISGDAQDERDWLPLPAALVTVAALMLYGAGGLLFSLPRNLPLLRAGRADSPAVSAATLDGVLRQRPYFVEARFLMAEMLLVSNRLDEATKQYETALRSQHGMEGSGPAESFRQRLTRHHLRRAQLEYQRGRWRESLASYRHVLENPDRRMTDLEKADLHNSYAWILADKLNEELKDAEAHALEATRLAKDNAAYIDTLAWVYYRQRRYREALTQQTRATSLAERRPEGASMAEYYYHLGAIHEGLGDRAQALLEYARAVRATSDYTPAAEALRRLGHPVEAPAPPARPQPEPPAVDPAIRRGVI